MKKRLHHIYRHRHFLLFILLFAYAQSIHSRISVREEINIYTFTPEAAFATCFSVGILFGVILFFIRYWQRSALFSTKELFKIFTSSLVVHLFVMQVTGLALAFIFGTVERNFNQQTFTLSFFNDLLDVFIYGSFFLAYYYYNRNKTSQLQLATYNQALSESRINQLKTQLNPHFLFNNLNILDQLIEEDKDKASEFLNEFAEIYRYVLQATDKKLISVEEELTFAVQYFKLLQHKYGTAYELIIEHKNSTGYTVPLTLQLLLENAIQHNMGTISHPVCIRISIDKTLYVSNNINKKRNTKQTSGRALKNLQEQYSLLSDKPIEIQQSANIFSVTVPIIRTI